MARLIFQLGDGKTVDFDLSAAVVTLGRSTSNDIVINNGWISSHHAKFERSGGTIEVTSLGTLHGIPLKEYKRIGGSYTVTDLDSHNGVMVNGARVTTAELKAGDILAFGQLEALFEETAAPPATPALIQTDPIEDAPEPAAAATPPPLPPTASRPPDLPFASPPAELAAATAPAPSRPATQHLVKKSPPVPVTEATPPPAPPAPPGPPVTSAPPVPAPAPVVPAPNPAAIPAPTGGASAIPTPAVRERDSPASGVAEPAPSPPAISDPARPAAPPRLAPRPEPAPRVPAPTPPAAVAEPEPAAVAAPPAPPATTKTAKTALASIQRDVALLERTLGALQENPEPERDHALAKGLIQRIDLLEDLIEAAGKSTPDLAGQLRPLHDSLLELLREHSIEAYTVTPGQALDVATRKRITIVEAATEGEGITEIAEVFRPGYRFTRGSGDLPAVILRKAEVRTLRRPLR